MRDDLEDQLLKVAIQKTDEMVLEAYKRAISDLRYSKKENKHVLDMVKFVFDMERKNVKNKIIPAYPLNLVSKEQLKNLQHWLLTGNLSPSLILVK